jgi:hypothetical protein
MEGTILHHYAVLDMVGMIGTGGGTASNLLLNPWTVLRLHAREKQGEGCRFGRLDLEQFAHLL